MKLLVGIFRRLWLRVSRSLCPENKAKVVHARINGYELLVLANEAVGRSIVFGGGYETVETKYLSRKMFPDAVCVDIGANVGYFTMLMGKVACNGSVHAFEPIPQNTALIRASIELNGFSNIQINQCAVGDHTASIPFAQAVDSAYSSLKDTKRKPLGSTFQVPIVALDEYLDRNGIKQVDFLKADVEGAEGLVVAGASKLLGNQMRRPRLVMLELFEENLQAFGTSVKKVIEDMQCLGYRPFVITDKEEVVPFRDELKAQYYNLFFHPSAEC